MTVDYLPKALKALEDAPAEVRKAFYKQLAFVGTRPSASLAARQEIRRITGPLAGARESGLAFLLQCRRGDTYIIRDIVPHPK